MPELEVNIFNQKLKLSYQIDEKKRILKAIEVLNNNWKKFSNLHGKVSDLKIVTLICIELQDSIGDIKFLKDKLNLKKTENNLLTKEITSKKKETQESKEIIKTLQSQLNNKKEELSKLEYILDEFHNELIEIKNNILKKNE
ncbi:hypothetical protein OAJ21_01730 [Pelagibacteraceae bacterium]|nr:hypothetical protein [Pelagibacteraceae bacterium]